MKIGFTELLVILAVALIVLGPDKMPYYAKKLGEALKEFRKVSSEATKDIRESVIEPLEEVQRPLREAMEPLTELEKDIQSDVVGIKKSFADLGKPEPKAPASKKEPVIAQEETAIPEEPSAPELSMEETPEQPVPETEPEGAVEA